MIKKILCPTDFSDAAQNGINYAAKVAQQFSAELILFNVRSHLVPVFGPSVDVVLNYSSQTLTDICKEVSRAYKISCKEIVELSDQSLEAIVQKEADEETVLIVGSNGVHSLSELLFGSHAYRIVELSSRPVWVVPQDFEYGSIQNIVIALKHNQDISALSQLTPFTEIIHPHITILTISEKTVTEERLEQLKGQIKKYFPKEPVDFHHIYGHRSPETIVEFSLKHKTDLLVLTYETEKVLFRKDVTRELISEPQIPILILPQVDRTV